MVVVMAVALAAAVVTVVLMCLLLALLFPVRVRRSLDVVCTDANLEPCMMLERTCKVE